MNDIDSYTSFVDSLFSTMVRKYNTFQLEDHTNQTIVDGTAFMKKGTQLLTTLKEHVKSLETLLSDCRDFIKEVSDDISASPKPEDFVYHTSGGMLAYRGRELIAEGLRQTIHGIPVLERKVTNKVQDKKPSDEIDTSIPKIPVSIRPDVHTEKITIAELKYNMRMPIITDLKNLVPAMYYYKGDQHNPPGIYMNILAGNIVRIPFPEIIDSKREYDRTHSIRCKYNKKEACDVQRAQMAKMYSSTIRTCNFAHTGDSIMKIGYPSRCPSVPDFGNPRTLATDMRRVTAGDVKNILMYGLNDLITAVVWLDHNEVTKQIMPCLEKA
jgi:hypothetical protein